MKALVALCFSLAAMSAACHSTVNDSITIPAGTRHSATYRSVNGEVRLEAGSSARAVITVNGPIRLEADSLVTKDVASVNGEIDCGKGARVDGGVTTVNGSVRLEGVQVGKDVSTYNGSIQLAGTRVSGNLVVKEAKGGDSGSRKTMVITLTQGAWVQGSLRIEDGNRDVEVRMDATSGIQGGTGRAKVVRI